MAGDFSDEEWDISDDQLQVLEHSAISSTQQKQIQDDSDGRSNTNIHSGSTVRLETPVFQKAAAAIRLEQQNLGQLQNEDSFDNPTLDEDGVPLVIEEQSRQTYARPRKENETALRERWKLSRFAQKNGLPQYRPPARVIPHQAYRTYQQRNPQYEQPTKQHQAAPTPKTPGATQFTPSSQAVAQQPQHPPEQAAMQDELERERKEREILQQKLTALTNELHTARGEAALIRNKNANEAKAAEGRLNAAKKQMQEQRTQHQAELRSKEDAFNTLLTKYNLAKHDLDEQTHKTNALQRQSKEKSIQDRSNETIRSPRRDLQDALRDGFDDSEIMQLSPAKPKTPRPSTPSKKRKLPVNGKDEPILTLMPSQPQQPQAEAQAEAQEQQQPELKSEAKPVKDHQTEKHLNLLQTILVFSPPTCQDTLLESLVRFSFPSDSTRSLSSLVLFETSKLEGARLPGDLLGIFMQLLSRCVQEEYHKPVPILLATIDLILDLNPTIVDAEVVQTLLRPLQTLATINPRKVWLLDKNNVWGEKHPKPERDPNIDTTACLELLLTVVSLILDEPELIRLFWRCMDTEFILLMLSPIHRIPDLHLMLELLATSIQPSTFGNICTAEEQARMETYIVDKVCFLLWDPPRRTARPHPRRPYSSASMVAYTNPRLPKELPEASESAVDKPPTRLEICNLRLQVLYLLSSLLLPTPHPHPHPDGSQANRRGVDILLTHPTAIARLVRSLYDEVALLPFRLPTHSLHAKLVNTITTLLHHLLLSPSATKSSFNLQQALSGTLVGAHRFRIAMTRVAFREERTAGEIEIGVAGISEDSARKATEVLEEYVTPDEARQLVEVVGRGDGEAEDYTGAHYTDRMHDDDAATEIDEGGDRDAEEAEADVMAGIEY